MKQCNKCNKSLDFNLFSKDKSKVDGFRTICRACTLKTSRTKKATISYLISHHKSRGIENSLKTPTYDINVFRSWLENDWLFNLLYENWVNLGYPRWLKPSIDRIDNAIGYTLSNMRIVTCLDNLNYANHDRRKGNLRTIKVHTPVLQYTKDGIFIREFVSQQEAGRVTGINQANISNCCTGKKYCHTAGGFKWEYKGKDYE